MERLLAEDYATLDVAAVLLKLVIGEKGKEESQKGPGSEDTRTPEGMVRMIINAGRKQKISKANILGAVAGETGISGKLIGKIEVNDTFTFVDVPGEYVQDIQKALSDVKIKGKRIRIEPAGKR